jgi:predicted secreted protein
MQLDRLAPRFISVRWLSLLLLAAIASLSHPALAADKVITDVDKGGVVHLKAGERFEVRLKSNPTIGFMWYMEKESTPIVRPVRQSHTDVTDESEDKRLGRPVYQVFSFEAKRFGDGVLLLHYVRSWEKPTPEDEPFQIHVFIQ